MLKKILLTITIFFIVLIGILNNCYAIDALTFPETDVNLRIANINKSCNVYFLLPTEMLKYNMEKFISNNLDNSYDREKSVAEKLQGFLDKEDYLGYFDYFKELGFEVEDNEIEIRHFSIGIGKSEVQDYEEIDGQKYVRIKIYLNYNNEFKLILKDYLKDYDPRDSKIIIEEYGEKTDINLRNYELTTNELHPNITECNATYEYNPSVDYDEVQKTAKIVYWILNIIMLIIAIIVFRSIRKYKKAKKQEVEDRKFWKKKYTKEELKEQKKKEKEEKKANKKNKKKKK